MTKRSAADPRPLWRGQEYNVRSHTAIIKAIATGCGKAAAAAKGGVTYPTLLNWLTKGKSGDPKFEKFAIDFLEAEANYQQGLLSVIHEKFEEKGGGDLALRLLKARFPEEWGDAPRTNAQVAFGNLDFSKLSHQELEAFKAIVGKAGGMLEGDEMPALPAKEDEDD